MRKGGTYERGVGVCSLVACLSERQWAFDHTDDMHLPYLVVTEKSGGGGVRRYWTRVIITCCCMFVEPISVLLSVAG